MRQRGWSTCLDLSNALTSSVGQGWCFPGSLNASGCRFGRKPGVLFGSLSPQNPIVSDAEVLPDCEFQWALYAICGPFGFAQGCSHGRRETEFPPRNFDFETTSPKN